ncbi:MAG: hypothetical protein JXB42_10750 [Deltaproteobacteria bacterium]|nr:hypothetical protein [Deltaproteobacteria bacterium]
MDDSFTKRREDEKKAIFDGMSPRRREKVLKKMSYEEWDPFQKPKEPIDMREQRVNQLASFICKRFLLETDMGGCSSQYLQAVTEMCKGLIKKEEKFKAMYDFCSWYRKIEEEIPSL